jgi:hypothetical protein
MASQIPNCPSGSKRYYDREDPGVRQHRMTITEILIWEATNGFTGNSQRCYES